MPVQRERKVNELGQEVPDDTPVEVPLKFRENLDIHSRLKDYVRSELFAMKAEEAGLETEEEANDFDVEEEDGALPISQAERAFMMAEELEKNAQDLVEMEGVIQRRPEVPAAEEPASGVSGTQPPPPETKVPTEPRK